MQRVAIIATKRTLGVGASEAPNSSSIPPVKLRTTFRRWLAGWLVLATLFTQLATAAYACPTGAGTGAEPAVAMPCGMAMDGGATMAQLDPEQPGLCVQHCQAPSQALDQGHSPSVPAPAAMTALAVAAAPAAVDESVAWASRSLRRDRIPPPPHSILHCCFRI